LFNLLEILFQEAHHYRNEKHICQPLSVIESQDMMKKMQALRQGITLIIVPFWWDRTPQSLIATVKAARPDLLSDVVVTSPPIPLDMPIELGRPIEFIEGVGEPMNACFLTRDDADPTGWYSFLFCVWFVVLGC
jgi:hypothetical protein